MTRNRRPDRAPQARVPRYLHPFPAAMPLHAIVREAVYDPAKLAKGRDPLDEFQEIHEDQPGYHGTLVVDVGDGHWFTVNLWESPEHARAALPEIGPVVERLLEPMMAEPSKLLGQGPVVLTDLADLLEV